MFCPHDYISSYKTLYFNNKAHFSIDNPFKKYKIGKLRRHCGAWLSLVEHLVRDQGVAGSNPVAPSKNVDNNITGAKGEMI